MAMSGSGEPDAPAAPDFRVINTSNAAAAALKPTNMINARPFTPRRSLSQPVARTEIAPTPGNIPLMRAALPLPYPR